MNIAFCSLLLPEEKHLSERARERLSGIASHKLARGLIQGLDANLQRPLTVFNIINTLNYPKFPELFFPTEQWHHTTGADDWHIGYVNLFGIKYITQECGLYRKLERWVQSQKGKTCMICVYYIYYPAMKAVCRIRRRFGNQVKICLITGDMAVQRSLPSDFSKPSLKKWLIHFVENGINRMVPRFDSFVFATKDMASGFGVENKPYTVLECTYATPVYEGIHSNHNLNSDNKNVIFYAGVLREEYGIKHLLRAFSMIEDSGYRLWLAGGGSAESMIQDYAESDCRVEFLGFLPPQEVALRQENATVLINPRTSELEFVKYSFPSKTMECLASGKPFIAHRLPCNPPEYDAHIQYPEDETDRALRDKIVEICELSQAQRDEIGIRAQKFIAEEKNPAVMCRRIVDMWRSLEDS